VIKILNASGHQAVPHSPSTGVDLLSGRGLSDLSCSGLVTTPAEFAQEGLVPKTHPTRLTWLCASPLDRLAASSLNVFRNRASKLEHAQLQGIVARRASDIAQVTGLTELWHPTGDASAGLAASQLTQVTPTGQPQQAHRPQAPSSQPALRSPAPTAADVPCSAPSSKLDKPSAPPLRATVQTATTKFVWRPSVRAMPQVVNLITGETN
jgi:hypothetical protein